MIRTTAFVLALSLSASGVSASAADLAQEKDINDGLLTLAVADKIRRSCGNIGGRFFKAQGYANDLKSVARSRGYSSEEIDTYVNSDVEKAKMRERRNAYFAARGASNLDPMSLCRLGHEEIARKSAIGQFLTAK